MRGPRGKEIHSQANYKYYRLVRHLRSYTRSNVVKIAFYHALGIYEVAE